MHRMRYGSLIAGLLIGIVFGPRSSEAQYTADFQTNIISGVTSNWTGDYRIGCNTFANVLLIQNNGVLYNSIGYLGYASGSSNNNVVVTGIGSVWSNRSPVYVGFGFNNNLVISNGGQVFSAPLAPGIFSLHRPQLRKQ